MLPSLGNCVVGNRTARLEQPACSRCLARFGVRRAELAARIRRDPRFAEICLSALQSWARRAFTEYFGAVSVPAPRCAEVGSETDVDG
jgi:hypothetical protein